MLWQFYFQMLARRGELKEAYMLRKLFNRWDDSINLREIELWDSIENHFEPIIEIRSDIHEMKLACSDSNSIESSVAMALLNLMDAAVYGIHWCVYCWHGILAPKHRLHMLEKSIVTALM